MYGGKYRIKCVILTADPFVLGSLYPSFNLVRRILGAGATLARTRVAPIRVDAAPTTVYGVDSELSYHGGVPAVGRE